MILFGDADTSQVEMTAYPRPLPQGKGVKQAEIVGLVLHQLACICAGDEHSQADGLFGVLDGVVHRPIGAPGS